MQVLLLYSISEIACRTLMELDYQWQLSQMPFFGPNLFSSVQDYPLVSRWCWECYWEYWCCCLWLLIDLYLRKLKVFGLRIFTMFQFYLECLQCLAEYSKEEGFLRIKIFIPWKGKRWIRVEVFEKRLTFERLLLSKSFR